MSEQLLLRIKILESQLEEAQEALLAFRNGEVDAVINQTDAGPKVYLINSAEHPYHAHVEAAQEGMATLSKDGITLFANTRVAEMLGVESNHCVGTAFSAFVDEASFDDFEVLLRESAQTKRSGEISLIKNGGGLLPVFILLQPLNGEGVAAISAVITDLSERNQQQTEILQLNQTLVLVNRAKDALMLGISDDLRTPLNSIIALTKGKMLDAAADASSTQFLGSILELSKNLLSSVNDIKDFAMIEVGKVALVPEPVIVADVVSEAVSAAISTATAAGSNFEVSMPSDRLIYLADRRILLKLFRIVLTKMIKFQPGASFRIALYVDSQIEFSVLTTLPLNPELAKSVSALLNNKDRVAIPMQGHYRVGFYLLLSLAALSGIQVAFQSEEKYPQGFILRFAT